MIDGKSRHDWIHTSNLMERITNCMSMGKSKPVTAAYFNPHEKTSKSTGIPLTPDNFGLLKKAFIKDG